MASFSTSHTIISLIENIQKIVDDKQIACEVFIYLEKAFDTVDHTLLLFFWNSPLNKNYCKSRKCFTSKDFNIKDESSMA